MGWMVKSIDTCDFGSINCASMCVWGLATGELMKMIQTESEMIQTR